MSVEPAPLITEDVLLLLFQPSTGAILGEDILYYVLGGAVIGDLALGGHIRIDDPTSLGGRRVHAIGRGPEDDLLRPAWERIEAKPRDVQTVLAESGPLLRQPAIDRLVTLGHLRAEEKKTLGIFTTTALSEGSTGRRADVLNEVRAVLVDGAQPTPRTAAIVGLVAASGELVNLHREIPWTSEVIERAHRLLSGDAGAAAAGAAVVRTDVAVYVSTLAAAGVFGATGR